MEAHSNADNYSFRLAEDGDIPTLIELNKKWQVENLTDKNEGFLSAQFNSSDLNILIANKEVVVVAFGENVVGYYLLNNFCLTKKFSQAQEIIRTLTGEGKIGIADKVGIGAQALIDRSHQGKGLSRIMLKLLCENVHSKYDYLYSSVSIVS